MSNHLCRRARHQCRGRALPRGTRCSVLDRHGRNQHHAGQDRLAAVAVMERAEMHHKHGARDEQQHFEDQERHEGVCRAADNTVPSHRAAITTAQNTGRARNSANAREIRRASAAPSVTKLPVTCAVKRLQAEETGGVDITCGQAQQQGKELHAIEARPSCSDQGADITDREGSPGRRRGGIDLRFDRHVRIDSAFQTPGRA